MTENVQPTYTLDGVALRRAWWGTPLKMTLWLVLIAYVVAWIAAIYMSQPDCSRCTPGNTANIFSYRIGVFTPLLWALGFALIGFVFGEVGVGMVSDNSMKALGFVFLDDAHWLTQRVHAMAAKLDLPAPKVGIMNQVNAFAMGTSREDAAVILGVPLINKLPPDELNAVIGHELAHIASGDMRRMIFAEGYQNLFGFVVGAIGIVFTVLLQAALKHGHLDGGSAGLLRGIGGLGRYTLGFGSEVIVKGVSRSREFYADAIGASLSSPEAMARALERLGGITTAPTPAEDRYAYLMFRGGGGDLLSTHPTTENRVAALRSGEYLGRMRAAHTRRQQLRVQARAAMRQAGAGFMFGAGKVVELAVLGVQQALAAIAQRKAARGSMAPTRSAGDAGPGRIEPRF